MVCVSVDKSRVPKVYKCEKCNPRLLKLSVAEAKAIQMKYLETKKRKKLGKQKIIYIGGQDPESINICIDARRAGSTARFARRSCRPNVELQHMFSGGKLYVFGVAVEDIERGDEVRLDLFSMLFFIFL
uniref:SUI1 domain-containing protein n=1 Tax=Syphacia muris TaxID=451379 RepID=A0A0N5AMN4_9BILA